MNWGYKITIVIGVFMVGMLFMVFVAMQQTNDMFEENYYQKEIEFQGQINAQENLLNLSKETIIRDSSGWMVISLPKSSFEQKKDGTIEFLCLNNKQNDYKEALSPNENGTQHINKQKLKTGRYEVRIGWKNKETPFFHKSVVSI